MSKKFFVILIFVASFAVTMLTGMAANAIKTPEIDAEHLAKYLMSNQPTWDDFNTDNTNADTDTTTDENTDTKAVNCVSMFSTVTPIIDDVNGIVYYDIHLRGVFVPTTDASEDSVFAIYGSEYQVTEDDLDCMAKALYGEANAVESKAERAMVIWNILNRLDSGRFQSTISEIVTEPHQYDGYDKNNPVTDECLSLVRDVVSRWEREKSGEYYVGRTLPAEYCYFVAGTGEDYGHNVFYRYSNINEGEIIYYDYSNPVENPYYE